MILNPGHLKASPLVGYHAGDSYTGGRAGIIHDRYRARTAQCGYLIFDTINGKGGFGDGSEARPPCSFISFPSTFGHEQVYLVTVCVCKGVCMD